LIFNYESKMDNKMLFSFFQLLENANLEDFNLVEFFFYILLITRWLKIPFEKYVLRMHVLNKYYT
jgi:hypothetical protein